MAEDDIYFSRRKYESFKKRIPQLLNPPSPENYKRKYYCKNSKNLDFFYKLCTHFEAMDLSYIRRLRIFQTMKFAVCHTDKYLPECDRSDIQVIMAAMHENYSSTKSKETFIIDLKYIWKVLMPELDEKGRPDETIAPYVVRHLSSKVDKSRQKLREDKLTADQLESIIGFFGNEPRMQAYLALALESLSRPQELLYRRIKNVEIFDGYAKIYITDHGKEGVGLLQCIDSFPYLMKWLEMHPFRNDPEAFLFINTGYKKVGQQLKPANINKMLRRACKVLKIEKPITCYSLKRNGVTLRILRGESSGAIRHVARWTSDRQLKTYDLSTQDDAFKQALERKGLILPDKRSVSFETKTCPFCQTKVGFNELRCPKCKHVLNRGEMLSTIQKDTRIKELEHALSTMNKQFENMKGQIMEDLMNEILAKRMNGLGNADSASPQKIS